MEGKIEEVNRLLVEVLARAPANQDAISRLSGAALSGGPLAPAAREALQTAQAAAPGEQALALATAAVLLGNREPAKALAILEAEPLKAARRGPGVQMMTAEAYAAQEKWAEAETASRSALAEDPENALAARQLATLLARKGDNRAAQATIERSLTTQPGSALLQQTLVELVRQERGIDAALEAADRIAVSPRTRPASLLLRGDLLMTAQRPEDAAAAYAAAYEQMPSRDLALRRAGALMALRKPAEATAVLNAWMVREPGDAVVEAQLAQIDLAAGRNAEAERRLRTVVAAAPSDGVSLNNLAWMMQSDADPATPAGKARLEEARLLAERGYFLNPSAETSDTLGWILVRGGNVQEALPLMRQAAAVAASRRQADPGIFYRLAYTLNRAGQKEEARKVLEPLVAADATFPERDAAVRLLGELRAGG